VLPSHVSCDWCCWLCGCEARLVVLRGRTDCAALALLHEILVRYNSFVFVRGCSDGWEEDGGRRCGLGGTVVLHARAGWNLTAKAGGWAARVFLVRRVLRSRGVRVAIGCFIARARRCSTSCLPEVARMCWHSFDGQNGSHRIPSSWNCKSASENELSSWGGGIDYNGL
jgi:hypothetical protein